MMWGKRGLDRFSLGHFNSQVVSVLVQCPDNRHVSQKFNVLFNTWNGIGVVSSYWIDISIFNIELEWAFLPTSEGDRRCTLCFDPFRWLPTPEPLQFNSFWTRAHWIQLDMACSRLVAYLLSIITFYAGLSQFWPGVHSIGIQVPIKR